MYYTLLNGGTPEYIADILTELAIPTGGRRKDGTLNTHWTDSGVISILRNEKHCGDVLARKYYTPNYKDHKKKKNNGKKNKYYQPDHHDAIVSRTVWNAVQRILNSRRFGHEGSYLPIIADSLDRFHCNLIYFLTDGTQRLFNCTFEVKDYPHEIKQRHLRPGERPIPAQKYIEIGGSDSCRKQ